MPGVLEQMFAQQKQEKPSGMLGKLKSMVSPNSTAGMVGNRDSYNKYVLKAGEEGEEPVSFSDFLAALKKSQGGK